MVDISMTFTSSESSESVSNIRCGASKNTTVCLQLDISSSFLVLSFPFTATKPRKVNSEEKKPHTDKAETLLYKYSIFYQIMQKLF